MRKVRVGVLIIGGGGAGLSAALAAAETFAQAPATEISSNLPIAVVSKVFPMRSHTVAAEGGAAGVHLPGDTTQTHITDTIRGGAGLADEAAVSFTVNNAPTELARLERMGMPWSRTEDGDVAVRPFGGMSQPRTWYAADKTGFHLLHTLYQTALAEPTIHWFNEYLALDLQISQNEPAVLLAYSQADGEQVEFEADAIIIATGGYARAWASSTNADICTGDGHALALRAGLPLRDMEFVQWHPTCLPGTGLLITEAARGEGGVLRDAAGQRYLADYGLGPETPLGQPEPRKMELGPRDAISLAFTRLVSDGRAREIDWPTIAGVRKIPVVDLDLTHLGAEVLKEKLPFVTGIAKRYARVDPARVPIPVCPAAHYVMGGIATDAEGRVVDSAGPVPGIFAAGECACSGLHGANRLGSNSLVETLVIGRATGTAAAELALQSKNVSRETKPPSSDDPQTSSSPALLASPPGAEGSEAAQPPQPSSCGPAHPASSCGPRRGIAGSLKALDQTTPAMLRSELGEILDNYVGITTDGIKLEKAQKALTDLLHKYKNLEIKDTSKIYNTEWQQYLELGSLLICAQATVTAALNREESRGAFQRTDFPNTAAKAQHSLTRLTKDGKFEVTYE